MHEASIRPEELVRHAEFVRRLARSLSTDDHAAEDAAQETARAALERPPRPGAPRGWLATVARNFVRRAQRGEARRARREELAAREEALPSAHAVLEREETLRRVVAAVGALPEAYRVVVTLRFYDDLPPRAIARRLALPVETVRTQLRRALARLREELARSLGDGRRDWRAALARVGGATPPSVAGAGALLAAAAAVALLAVGVALAGWGRQGPSVGLASSGEGETAAGPLAAPAGAEPRAAVAFGEHGDAATAAPGGALLAGRVLDEEGEPAVGTSVCVLGATDPFPSEHPGPEVGWNDLVGRSFAVAADGSWRAELPAPGRVHVALGLEVGFESVEGGGDDRDVEAPAERVDFTVRRVPTASVLVRAVHAGSRKPLSGFGVSVHGDPGPACEHVAGRPAIYTLGYASKRADGDVATVPVVVRAAAGLWCHVALHEGDAPAQQVRVRAGETHELLFVLGDGSGVQGQVVDRDGRAVEGALVFFGDRTSGRGDEPFRAFRASRIAGGATSGADGWFELEGRGATVAAWHPEHSQALVPVESAGRIVLGPRGAIRGRIVDAHGLPRAHAELELDRRSGVRATTDDAGAFAFERVEAGAHGLYVDGELEAGVRVEPGEACEVEIALGGGRLRLELFARGEPTALDALEGALIGADRVFDVVEVEQRGGRTASLDLAERVAPGRYLLVSRQGFSAPVVVGAERARVDLGAAELRVLAAADFRAQAVPAGSDELTRLVAARVPARAQGDGELLFRVAPGRWLVVGERGVVLGEAEVPAEGATLDLR